jgi:5-methylcytosine-specific restriction endonuclease McrA
MKKESIKNHLNPYSIYRKRKTTIHHAFASALAPNDNYNAQTIDNAIRALGQNPDEELKCIYCLEKAQTWDHLVSLVKNSELRGYGHQIGNLVPCCKNCNSKKGAKDWQEFIKIQVKDEKARSILEDIISNYLFCFANEINLEQVKLDMFNEYTEYITIKNEILNLMKRADEIAKEIRDYNNSNNA